MKKIVAMLLALGLVAGICAGCGKDASADNNQPKTEASAPTEKTSTSKEDTSAPEEGTADNAKTDGAIADGDYEVDIDMMGENVPVKVTISDGGTAFKFTYEFKDNNIEADGTIGEDGAWTVVNDASGFASMVAPDIQAAVAAQ